MSVRAGLLALLAEGARYGAQLKAEFEARTGGTWPVNVGQVYTTLDRLERDGLVAAEAADADGRIRYSLTGPGRAAVGEWWRTPVDREVAPRDELVIKLAIATTSPGVDSAGVAQAQRSATMGRLQQLTRLKQSVDPATDLAWLMVGEHELFAAEAEIRWLDQVEASVARHGRTAPVPAPEQEPEPARPLPNAGRIGAWQ
jgi:DNA-binding PadR family transcriptional regulator